MQDNEAVINMTIKGRSPALRHVTRTHRVDLDWLFERINSDPAMRIRFTSFFYVSEMADVMPTIELNSQTGAS